MLQAAFCLLSHPPTQQGATSIQPVSREEGSWRCFLSAMPVDCWEFGYSLTSKDNTQVSLCILPLTNGVQLMQNLQELLLFFDDICWSSLLLAYSLITFRVLLFEFRSCREKFGTISLSSISPKSETVLYTV